MIGLKSMVSNLQVNLKKNRNNKIKDPKVKNKKICYSLDRKTKIVIKI